MKGAELTSWTCCSIHLPRASMTAYMEHRARNHRPGAKRKEQYSLTVARRLANKDTKEPQCQICCPPALSTTLTPRAQPPDLPRAVSSTWHSIALSVKLSTMLRLPAEMVSLFVRSVDSRERAGVPAHNCQSG